jgi:hypothetical protein
MTLPSSGSTFESPPHERDAGSTLLEVLTAIFVSGLALLALLTLFPLGALRMADAIKDDRTAAVADEAVGLAAAGEHLLEETATFAAVSIANGQVDSDTAAALRREYEDLRCQVEDLEKRIEALTQVFPPQLIQPHARPLVAQLHAIEARIGLVIQLLRLLGGAP